MLGGDAVRLAHGCSLVSKQKYSSCDVNVGESTKRTKNQPQVGCRRAYKFCNPRAARSLGSDVLGTGSIVCEINPDETLCSLTV